MINETGIIYQILEGLNYYVWGNMTLTALTIVIFFTLIALLSQVPLPFALALNIPLIIIMTASGFLPVVVGGLFTITFLILSVFAFYNGVGLNN